MKKSFLGCRQNFSESAGYLKRISTKMSFLFFTSFSFSHFFLASCSPTFGRVMQIASLSPISLYSYFQCKNNLFPNDDYFILFTVDPLSTTTESHPSRNDLKTPTVSVVPSNSSNTFQVVTILCISLGGLVLVCIVVVLFCYFKQRTFNDTTSEGNIVVSLLSEFYFEFAQQSISMFLFFFLFRRK